MNGVSKVLFPLLWSDEAIIIDDKNADLYKSRATIPLILLDVFSLGVGLGLGSLGIVASLVILFLQQQKEHKKDLVIQKVK